MPASGECSCSAVRVGDAGEVLGPVRAAKDHDPKIEETGKSERRRKMVGTVRFELTTF